MRSGANQYGIDIKRFHLMADSEDGVLYVYGGEGRGGVPYGFSLDSGTNYAYGGEGADGMD